MLKLIEQNHLIKQYGTQYNQLGALQTFDRDLTSPLKHVLEQAIERFDGLVTQLVEYLAHLGSAILARVWSTPRGDQQAVVVFTLLAKLRRIVVSITQHVAHFQWQLANQGRSWHAVVGIGSCQSGSQGDPDGCYGASQVKLPAIPPAVMPRFGPMSVRVDAGVRHNALISVLLVPYTPISPQSSAVQGCCSPPISPRLDQTI